MASADARCALLLAVVISVSAAAPASQRHPLVGHYKLPQTLVWHRPSPTGNVVTNPGFESGNVDGGWYQCGDVPALTTREHPFSGSYDEYSGTPSGRGEPAGNSGVCQQVTIPPGGVLTAQLYQLTDESDATFAFQEADLLDARGNVVVNLYKSANRTAGWTAGTWNLGAYAGRTFWLYFGVHGDGYSGRSTQQFVDDVSLTARVSGAPK